MVSSTPVDVEPTPEFNAYCLDLITRWEAGEITYKEALARINTKQQEAVNDNHIANQGRAEQVLGYIQHYRGELNASIRHYERARQFYQQAGNTQRIATTDLNLGENYRLKGDFIRARRLYRATYEAAAALDNPRLQSVAIINEGLALISVSQMSQARTALEEGIQLLEPLDETVFRRNAILCEAYQGLTAVYLHEGDMPAAWEAAKKSLNYAQETQEKIQLGIAYRNMGEIITHIEHSPEEGFENEPDEYFRLALEIFRERLMEAEIARTIFAQARSMAHQGRKTTAARKLQQVMIMFTQLGMVDDAAKAAQAQLAVL